jgi:hypothetical protein
MRTKHSIGIGIVALCTFSMIGCGSDVGVKVEPMTAQSHVLPGTPEQRIAAIQADPQMSAVEKQRRITAIKERNHLQ